MFNDLFKNLGDIQNVTDLLQSDAFKNFPIQDILSSEFLQKFTDFQSIEEFIAKSGFSVQDILGFVQGQRTEEADKFINDNSTFSTVAELVQKAMAEYMSKK